MKDVYLSNIINYIDNMTELTLECILSWIKLYKITLTPTVKVIISMIDYENDNLLWKHNITLTELGVILWECVSVQYFIALKIKWTSEHDSVDLFTCISM